MTNKPSPLRAFLYSLILPHPAYSHQIILHVIDGYKIMFNMYAASVAGGDGGATYLPKFLTSAYELHFKLTKSPYRRYIDDLLDDLELLNNGRFNGMQRLEDVRTLILRLERLSDFECDCFSFTGDPDKLVSIGPGWGKDSITANDISFGGVWGIPTKTMHEWMVQYNDPHQGVRGTDFFNSRNKCQIMDYYATKFIQEEAAVLNTVIERMTAGLYGL